MRAHHYPGAQNPQDQTESQDADHFPLAHLTTSLNTRLMQLRYQKYHVIHKEEKF